MPIQGGGQPGGARNKCHPPLNAKESFLKIKASAGTLLTLLPFAVSANRLLGEKESPTRLKRFSVLDHAADSV